MDGYRIIITPDAEADLNELDDYISFYLMAPDIAISCIRYIRSKIAGLRKAPKRYRLIEDEPWHSRGIRRMNAKGFAVFYLINEVFHEVYVLNVIYQKRDIQHIIQEL